LNANSENIYTLVELGTWYFQSSEEESTLVGNL
jgi:hypothetical protein